MGAEERYDRFQQEAVDAIVADFKEKPSGRFLLVIPTGGGKTYTAVKAVSKLYDTQYLAESERVLWVVHRQELKTQAQDTFRDFALRAQRPSLPGMVDVAMLSEIKDYLHRNPTTRLAVVDEAHHVAANSYQRLFEQAGLGILGLTATPSRHDGRPLQFDRESFSIGFPDLIELGVLLRPEVIHIEGGRYDISDIGPDSDSLEVLNNGQRNARIVSAIGDNQAKLHKAIIYVGTKAHAQEIYALLKASPLAATYESIGLILGGERKRFVPRENSERVNEERGDFIKAMKACRRALLVNVDVLTEGYDDKTVNAVVMARPTNSKLVYMQAMGRAVRLDPENPEKEAFVLEVADDLPNIRYRIDNRWLFSDVSDTLEPAVIDEAYATPADLPSKIEGVFDRYQVPRELRIIPGMSSRDRLTMLLFKVYSGPGAYRHIPVVVTNDTRQAASNFFNFLSARMKKLQGLALKQVIAAVRSSLDRFPTLQAESARRSIVQAMENAWDVVAGTASPAVSEGTPWVTFVSFHLRVPLTSLPPDLLAFTEDMLNRDTVRETLSLRSYADGYTLVKLPLPLRGTWGAVLPPDEFDSLRATVDALRPHADLADGFAQWKAAVDVLGAAKLPVENRHQQSMTTIVREGLDYYRVLSR